MNLVVDIGNTKVKVAVFELDTLIESVSVKESDFLNVFQDLSSKHTLAACIVSSVKKNSHSILSFLQQVPILIPLNHTTKVPFTNLYRTPKTLGIDRIALMAAASCQFPNKNTLVIDAGTCITYDFINSQKEYLGGAISPGIHIRYRSLHEFTSKLPLLSPQEDFLLIGNSTDSSIHSGIVNGIVQEIRGVIRQYQKKYPDLTVILTGGDTKFLSKQLKNSIFAHQNFLLYGLNQILTFNTKV